MWGRRAATLPRRDAAGRVARLLRGIGTASAEAVWSTRCIVCDRPGAVLCRRCRLELPYVDRWLACPRCGAPHGRLQCVGCNGFTLADMGRDSPPFERCVSAVGHEAGARAIVTGYKDAGERRLAHEIAAITCDAMPSGWKRAASGVTYVPADRRARRRRGFDHMEPIARECARILGLPCVRALEKRPVADQRGLGRHARLANMAGAISARPWPISAPEDIILVDDVYTTGATLFAACDALHESGVARIRCATFARVP